MNTPAVALPLSPLDRNALAKWAHSAVAPYRVVTRAKALLLAGDGVATIGFDIDAERTEAIARGDSYLADVRSDHLRSVVDGVSLSATTDFAGLATVDTINICVPPPLRKTRDPDLSHVVAAVDQVAVHLRAGKDFCLAFIDIADLLHGLAGGDRAYRGTRCWHRLRGHHDCSRWDRLRRRGAPFAGSRRHAQCPPRSRGDPRLPFVITVRGAYSSRPVRPFGRTPPNLPVTRREAENDTVR